MHKRRSVRIAIAGNPNVGKSTIFNLLTGHNSSVGNWPGVTVNREIKSLQYKEFAMEFHDLPGIYSIAHQYNASIDEKETLDILTNEEFDLILNIVDASVMERSLYLTLQLIETGAPVILLCNMIDEATNSGVNLKLDYIADELNVTVVPFNAINAQSGNISALLEIVYSTIHSYDHQVRHLGIYPESIQNYMQHGAQNGVKYSRSILELCEASISDSSILNDIKAEYGEDVDILIASSRYEFIHEIATNAVEIIKQKVNDCNSVLDNVLMHKFFALPIFLSIMYCIFWLTLVFGSTMQTKTNEYVTYGCSAAVANIFSLFFSDWARFMLIADGLIAGTSILISFIPIISMLYICLAVLEASGYMARIAFICNKVMMRLNLPGKSIIPLIIGFGCNVPAISAVKILPLKKHRIIVALMVPFSSCSARLSVYTIFGSAFFMESSYNIVFALYLIGILVGMMTGYVLNKLIPGSAQSYFIIELPRYRIPKLRTIAIKVYDNVRSFVSGAGPLIISSFFIIHILSLISIDGRYVEDANHSVLAKIAQFSSPVFEPLGVKKENWPAVIGIISGILAKEIVIANIDASYRGLCLHNAACGSDGYDLKQALNYYFGNKIAAFAYILFILLYFPCISTFSAIWTEIGAVWAVSSVALSCCVGYCISALFYCVAISMVALT